MDPDSTGRDGIRTSAFRDKRLWACFHCGLLKREPLSRGGFSSKFAENDKPHMHILDKLKFHQQMMVMEDASS